MGTLVIFLFCLFVCSPYIWLERVRARARVRAMCANCVAVVDEDWLVQVLIVFCILNAYHIPLYKSLLAKCAKGSFVFSKF